MKSYAGPGTTKMAKCIMPLLFATVETLVTIRPQNPEPRPHPPAVAQTLPQTQNDISGSCCFWHVYGKLAFLPPEIRVCMCCLCCMLHCLRCLALFAICLSKDDALHRSN